MGNSVTRWDYGKSVEKVKSLTFKWKNLSVDIVREIYEARKALDSRGLNRGKENVANGTFSQYLEDCGLERSTVHRWLERYIPEQDKLLTTQEYQEVKQIEDRKRMEHHASIRSMVVERIKTGKTPKDWNEEADKAYRLKLVEDRQRNEDLKKYQEEIERKRVEKEKRDAEFDELRKEADRSSEILKEATGHLLEQHRQRSEFKEKIRLSESGRTAPFIDAIMDYLDCLENDDRRIEACNNIVKVCRNIAVQLHQKTHKSA